MVACIYPCSGAAQAPYAEKISTGHCRCGCVGEELPLGEPFGDAELPLDLSWLDKDEDWLDLFAASGLQSEPATPAAGGRQVAVLPFSTCDT